MFTALNLPVVPERTFRLGKRDPSKMENCRPVKVQLSSESDVISVMKVSRRLREMVDWSGVSCYRDRTIMQRDIYRQVKGELQERLDRGEAGIRLRYRNGVPSIVGGEQSNTDFVHTDGATSEN